MPGFSEVNLWPSADHALDYLRRADSIPHRVEGEAALLEFIPRETGRILDLGSGAGRTPRACESGAPECEIRWAGFLSNDVGGFELHKQFLESISWQDEDPSNKLLDLETQVAWLRQIGFVDVDCHWKWRELALFAGIRPAILG